MNSEQYELRKLEVKKKFPHFGKKSLNRYILRENAVKKAQIRYQGVERIEIPMKKAFHCEAEIQSWLWGKLLKLGYNARLEVPANNRTSVFDIVIYSHKKPIIIEVKKKKGKGLQGRLTQLNKYSRFDCLSILYCCGVDEIDVILKEVESLLDD